MKMFIYCFWVETFTTLISNCKSFTYFTKNICCQTNQNRCWSLWTWLTYFNCFQHLINDNNNKTCLETDDKFELFSFSIIVFENNQIMKFVFYFLKYRKCSVFNYDEFDNGYYE